MSYGSDDTKEQVRQAIDIVELVGGYLELRRQGRIFVAQCPWHDDTRPSLQINPERQTWKCWVCDIGGDIFSFTQKREGLGFRESLELLADRAGIAIRRPKNFKPGGANDKAALYRAVAWAEELFHKCLMQSPEAEPAKRYADQRGLRDELCKRFRIGYAVNDWSWLLEQARKASVSAEVLEAAGLVGRSSKSGRFYDLFRGRLMFPIRDAQSRPLAFGGRILPEFADEGDDRQAAKYYNSPETLLFSKSDQLYALDLAREGIKTAAGGSREIIVVEGYTDVVALHDAGINNAVAVLGTALTRSHVRLLQRYADTIYLVLDGDDAGRRRTNEILELFIAADVDLRILTLPDELDPCDFVTQRGADEFRNSLASCYDALEHTVREATAGIDPANQTHLANQALERILQTLAKAPSVQSDSSKRLRQQQMLGRLARQFQVPEEEIRLRLESLRKAPSRPLATTRPAVDLPARRHRFGDLSPTERELLEILVSEPSLCATAKASIAPAQLDSDTGRTLFATFTELADVERTLEFADLMTRIDDADLKNVVVELDEVAGKKIVHVELDTATRLSDLVKQLSMRRDEQLQQEKVRSLQSGKVGAEEEMSVLEQLFQMQLQMQRDRQGISKPTDG